MIMEGPGSWELNYGAVDAWRKEWGGYLVLFTLSETWSPVGIFLGGVMLELFLFVI